MNIKINPAICWKCQYHTTDKKEAGFFRYIINDVVIRTINQCNYGRKIKKFNFITGEYNTQKPRNCGRLNKTGNCLNFKNIKKAGRSDSELLILANQKIKELEKIVEQLNDQAVRLCDEGQKLRRSLRSRWWKR